LGLAVWLGLHAPDLTVAQAADLMTRGHERCPYSVANRGNIEVTLMVDGMPVMSADTAAGWAGSALATPGPAAA